MPRTKKQSGTERPLDISEIRRGMDHSDVEVGPEILSELASCLYHASVKAEHLGTTDTTLKRWRAPNPKGQRVEVSILVLAMFAVNLRPERWDTLKPADCKKLSNQWEHLSRQPGANQIRTRSFELEFRDAESPVWRGISSTAQEYLKKGKENHKDDADGTSYVPFDCSGKKPLYESILDRVTDGRIAPNTPIQLNTVAVDIWKERGESVYYADVRHALDYLVARGDVRLTEANTYEVIELSDNEWKTVMEYRKVIEPLNIRILFHLENRKHSLHMLEEARGLVKEMEAAFSDNNIGSFFGADIKFHCCLAGRCRFQHELIKTVLSFIRRAGTRLRKPEMMREILNDHHDILKALAPYEDKQFTDEVYRKMHLPALEQSAISAMIDHLQRALELFTRS